MSSSTKPWDSTKCKPVRAMWIWPAKHLNINMKTCEFLGRNATTYAFSKSDVASQSGLNQLNQRSLLTRIILLNPVQVEYGLKLMYEWKHNAGHVFMFTNDPLSLGL